MHFLEKGDNLTFCIFGKYKGFYSSSNFGSSIQFTWTKGPGELLASVVCKLFTFQAYSSSNFGSSFQFTWTKDPGELLPSLGVRRLSSVNFSHFKLILRLILVQVFSSPGPKVQVNYYHHLASVVCKLFTFQAFSPKPQGQLEPSLAGMFLGWSSTKFLFFVPVGYSTQLLGPIICSDWLKFQRSSSLKLMN